MIFHTVPVMHVAAVGAGLCVDCSEEIGGEYELKVTVSGTAKPGSLKVTGQQVSVRRQRKPFH